MKGILEGALLGFLVGALSVATLAHTRETRLVEKIHDAQAQSETLREMVKDQQLIIEEITDDGTCSTDTECEANQE